MTTQTLPRPVRSLRYRTADMHPSEWRESVELEIRERRAIGSAVRKMLVDATPESIAVALLMLDAVDGEWPC